MPTKFNDEVYALYDGKPFKLGHITSVDVTPTSLDDNDCVTHLWEGQSGTFTAFWINPNSKAWKRELRRLGRGTNNYRKMHGLPLRRYT